MCTPKIICHSMKFFNHCHVIRMLRNQLDICKHLIKLNCFKNHLIDLIAPISDYYVEWLTNQVINWIEACTMLCCKIYKSYLQWYSMKTTLLSVYETNQHFIIWQCGIKHAKTSLNPCVQIKWRLISPRRCYTFL